MVNHDRLDKDKDKVLKNPSNALGPLISKRSVNRFFDRLKRCLTMCSGQVKNRTRFIDQDYIVNCLFLMFLKSLRIVLKSSHLSTLYTLLFK